MFLWGPFPFKSPQKSLIPSQVSNASKYSDQRASMKRFLRRTTGRSLSSWSKLGVTFMEFTAQSSSKLLNLRNLRAKNLANDLSLLSRSGDISYSAQSGDGHLHKDGWAWENMFNNGKPIKTKRT